MKYEKEEIVNDTDLLYRRIHIRFGLPKGRLRKAVFKQDMVPGFPESLGVSTDWDRYSTPQESRGRFGVDPDLYMVVSLKVEHLKEVGLDQMHDPLPAPHAEETDNRAHALVGLVQWDALDTVHYQTELLRICQWEITGPELSDPDEANFIRNPHLFPEKGQGETREMDQG